MEQQPADAMETEVGHVDPEEHVRTRRHYRGRRRRPCPGTEWNSNRTRLFRLERNQDACNRRKGTPLHCYDGPAIL